MKVENLLNVDKSMISVSLSIEWQARRDRTSWRRQIDVRLARMAAVRPPRSLPTKRLFFPVNTARFISRSEILRCTA